MAEFYILAGPDGKTPEAVDALRWSEEMFRIPANRVVRQEHIGEFFVSTVFLGLNHNFGWEGPPLLFETMVFAETTGASDLDCARYSTWAEAEAGHQAMVAKWNQRRKPWWKRWWMRGVRSVTRNWRRLVPWGWPSTIRQWTRKRIAGIARRAK